VVNDHALQGGQAVGDLVCRDKFGHAPIMSDDVDGG
jgi:hypothetical protein